jgi:hypothetical protein
LLSVESTSFSSLADFDLNNGGTFSFSFSTFSFFTGAGDPAAVGAGSDIFNFLRFLLEDPQATFSE